jgi:hypothetical protein
MNQSISNGMEIARGINLDVSEVGAWVISANDDAFPLEEARDFFLAWLLLERPFDDVKAALDRGVYSANPETPFPFWKLIGSALMGGSVQWTNRAMTWVPFLTMAEKISRTCLSRWGTLGGRARRADNWPANMCMRSNVAGRALRISVGKIK